MDDLISRQNLIVDLTVTAEETAQMKAGDLKKVINVINNQPSAQQWIPCSERLPEEDGLEVLFSSRRGRVHIGKYHDDASLNRWFSYRDKCRFMNYEVTAWMPLPKLYEVENNGHD